MKMLGAVTGLALTLVTGSVVQANAAGCLKGAAVGGVAGHVAGHHALMGAAAGCVVGRHEANKHAKQAAAAQPASETSTSAPQ